MSIETVDNFLDKPEEIIQFCRKSLYKWGERDTAGKPRTGMVCNLIHECPEVSIILKKIFELKPMFKNKRIRRIYINCFAPSEQPYFHIDGETGTTMLYYATDVYDPDEHGETQFLGKDDVIYGILPKPNRLVIFDANIRHRATAFRSKHRFTIAIKFE